MTKVITYGTYDMLHYGHIRLLKRARELGDYLIVGVTSDDYDQTRGKINNQQTLTERVQAVRETGFADEIIVEEYEGQKIDDIKRYDIDIFTVGSDWKGKFDYLNEYCKVIYLDRTQGVSSTEIRSKEREIRIGLVGNAESRILNKYCNEFIFVNGADVTGMCTSNSSIQHQMKEKVPLITEHYDELLGICDAVYIISQPEKHYSQIKKALLSGKHVLVESPVAVSRKECEDLFELARNRGLVLMDAVKTAYAMAYNRLLLLVKSGKIGKVVSIDAVCTSLQDIKTNKGEVWNSITAWGPTALLPVFQILGTEYRDLRLVSLFADKQLKMDAFTKADFIYESAIASVKVGRGVKAEGELIISGTEGYAYVPAPWWKTDYFEIRYENSENNKRYFYQLDGEGIRYEIVAFVKAIQKGENKSYIEQDVSCSIAQVMDDFYNNRNIELKQ